MALSVSSLALSLVGASIAYFFARLIAVRRFYKDLPKPPHSFLLGHLPLFARAAALFPPNTHPQYMYTHIATTYRDEIRASYAAASPKASRGRSNAGGGKERPSPDDDANATPNELFYIDLWPLGPAQLIVIGPTAAAQVVSVQSFPMHGEMDAFLTPVFGPGIIAGQNGDKWRAIHRVLAPAFSPSSVRAMLGPVAEMASVFAARLGEAVDKYAGEDGTAAVHMMDFASKFVFDVIGRVVFGAHLDAQGKGTPVLADMRYILENSKPPGAVGAMGKVEDAVRWLRDPVGEWRTATTRKQTMARVNKYMTGRILERRAALLTEKRRLQATRGPSGTTNIMDRVLLEKMAQMEQETGRADGELDAEFMEIFVNNMKGLLAGGHATTTDTLCYIYMFLGMYPAVMSRLRAEHDDVFDSDPAVCIDILSRAPQRTAELEYTTAVIKESLRIFPIGFGIRQAPDSVDSMVLPNDALRRAWPVRDQMVVVCQHTTHYDPTNWSDPAAFVPERFLESSNNAGGATGKGPAAERYAWRPFERGPRACMGQDLAMDELRIALLMTARWFDFELIVEEDDKAKVQKVAYTDWDTKIGEVAFQEIKMAASPRGEMKMRVRRTGRA